MGNGDVSIGDDTPTGEPENGPRGPYITDKDDGTRKPARSKEDSRQRRVPGKRPLPSRTETEITRKSELGSDRSGGGGGGS
jgi:hypothetical protein